MTVFDLAPSSAQVASATAVNVAGGPAVGALLQSSAGNSVVISGTAPVGTAIAGPLELRCARGADAPRDYRSGAIDGIHDFGGRIGRQSHRDRHSGRKRFRIG